MSDDYVQMRIVMPGWMLPVVMEILGGPELPMPRVAPEAVPEECQPADSYEPAFSVPSDCDPLTLYGQEGCAFLEYAPAPDPRLDLDHRRNFQRARHVTLAHDAIEDRATLARNWPHRHDGPETRQAVRIEIEDAQDSRDPLRRLAEHRD
jgi:hypothetical protein